MKAGETWTPSAVDVVSALELPAECAIRHRVAKKLLQESPAATAADRRLVQDVVEEIWWLGALKPEKTGIAPVNDDTREYLEIAVVIAGLRGKNDEQPSLTATRRIEELLHRSIPYPLFLLVERPEQHAGHALPANPAGVRLSLAHKRRAQNEAGRFVLEETTSVSLPEDAPFPSVCRSFLASLALSRLANDSLYALYQGWTDRLLALQAARITGRFEADTKTTGRRDALQEHEALEQEIRRLHARATRERQMAKRVELNLELKRLQARRDAVLQAL